MEYLELQGEKVPALGLGTWQLKEEECEDAVRTALKKGYRHIDTAQAYSNEARVGQAINDSEVSRGDIWLTTKVWRSNFNHDSVIKSVNESLEKLQTHYVDLLLIHWPSETTSFEETIKAMESLVDNSRVKKIGVSNFTVRQMQRTQRLATENIFTNQIEYHPFLDQDAVLEKCQEMEMMLTAYSPLARGDVIGNEALKEIGDKYGKSEIQVALRWLIQQKNVAAIPKASTEEHIEQNFNIFDFEISENEMRIIDELKRKNDRKVDPDFAPDWD